MKPMHGLVIAVAVIGFITYTKATTGTNPVSANVNEVFPTEKTQEQLWLEYEPTPKLVAKALPTSTPKKSKGVK